jgi:hypothetical protein
MKVSSTTATAKAQQTSAAEKKKPSAMLITREAYKKLVSNISNKIGDGGPVYGLKLSKGKDGQINFKGQTFMGPGGGMLPFTGQANKEGKILKFQGGEPQ